MFLVKSPGIQVSKEGNEALEYHLCTVIVSHNTKVIHRDVVTVTAFPV